MMPNCYRKGCRKIGEVYFGDIDTGDKDGYNNPWPVPVHLCKKHYKKMLKKLGLHYNGGEK